MLVAGLDALTESGSLLMPVLPPLGEVVSEADEVGLACAVAEGLPLPDGAVLALAE